MQLYIFRLSSDKPLKEKERTACQAIEQVLHYPNPIHHWPCNKPGNCAPGTTVTTIKLPNTTKH